MILTLLALLAAPAHADEGCDLSEAKAAAAAATLEAHWKADLADRENLDPNTPKHDAKRLKAVSKLDRKGAICSPESAYHAAWVLQRSTEISDLERAHVLARQAMNARIDNGGWLSAVTFDLLQVASGRPQRYGTQLRSESDRVCMFPVAADATDQEREMYQVQPIVEAYRNVLTRNALSVEPTSQALDRHELWCELKPW